jgi:hypothetical protein
MKKTLNIMLSLLFLFSISLSVSSQSDQKNLDQAKLAKQFIGNWVSEIGKDSIVFMEAGPSGEGLYMHLEWKAKGKTYATARSVLGFTENYESVVLYSIWQEGIVGKDIGKFVSPKKLVVERFISEGNHSTSLNEIEFPTPDTWTWTSKWRGMETTWEPLQTEKWIFTKVKK